jgi:hypothetical protein
MWSLPRTSLVVSLSFFFAVGCSQTVQMYSDALCSTASTGSISSYCASPNWFSFFYFKAICTGTNTATVYSYLMYADCDDSSFSFNSFDVTTSCSTFHSGTSSYLKLVPGTCAFALSAGAIAGIFFGILGIFLCCIIIPIAVASCCGITVCKKCKKHKPTAVGTNTVVNSPIPPTVSYPATISPQYSQPQAFAPAYYTQQAYPNYTTQTTLPQGTYVQGQPYYPQGQVQVQQPSQPYDSVSPVVYGSPTQPNSV